MISIIYSTHKDSNFNNKFKQHLLQTVGLKNVQILEYINHNEYSLSQVYNKGINESIHDIVVCVHNDIKLETGWGKKLLKNFEDNPDYGIIGKAGSCYFPESGIYWERMKETMVGQVYHHPENSKKWLSKYSAKLPFLIPVVTIDGLFISFNKTKVKYFFDETIGKFHFYDHLFCIPNYLNGVKIGVTTSFEITHQSVGQPNQEFFDSKTKFLEKWGNKLPLDIKPSSVYVPIIKEHKSKTLNKVAVIIPTKGKVEMLYDCVNSFYQNCSNQVFKIFIADTGSSDDEKLWIKNNILPLGDIVLIEYDYYNFAKINNDVVRNHVSDEYEYLLFCNNDIKILNNIIFSMLNVYKNYNNVGTVGCRLHFGDNTVQHDGIVALINSKKVFGVTHMGLKSYYNYTPTIKKVIGNTGGLLMIKKKLFEKFGFFNEKYINCFEDVELNLTSIIFGYDNYFDGNSVAYHYESQTRNEDGDNIKKLQIDYMNNLFPFVIKNLDKLKKHIQLTQ